MKTPRIVHSVGYIDEELIAEAGREGAAAKKAPWIKIGVLAACLTVIVAAVAIIAPMLDREENIINPDLGDKDIVFGESAIVWPWEYKTVYEKYLSLKLDGREYGGRGREISAELLGERLGSAEARGEDIYTDKTYETSFDVYSIKNVSQKYLIAAKMGEKYYVFDAHEPYDFSTLGDMMNAYGLPNNLELNRFSEEENYYLLNDDKEIWALLGNCREAAAVTEEWNLSKRAHISFTVTSEALGTYKTVMYITEDGYLWTNAFDYGYVFNIGEDAAEKIISHAKANSTQVEPEPYYYSLCGRISRVEDGYFILDDTELCTDPKNGKTYKIMTEDIRIKRCIEFARIGVGDIVEVKYDGTIKDGNIITTAYDMNEGRLVGGDMLIPE